MSLMGRSAKQHARAGDPIEVKLRNLVRRFSVTGTKGALWKLLGIRGLEGDETGSAEVFHGVGITARPPVDGQPEAIVVNVGGAKAPVIVATRDQRTLAGVLAELGELEAGSTLVYSAGAIVYVRANGTVEIRSPSGSANALATKADIDALKSWLTTHTHSGVTTGAGASGAPVGAPPSATGTTVLRGE